MLFKKILLLLMLSGKSFSMMQEDILGEPISLPYGDEMTTFYCANIKPGKLGASRSKFVYYTGSDKVPFYPTGELYAEIHDQSHDVLNYLLEKYHLECKENIGDGAFILKVTSLEDPVKIAEAIYKERKPGIDTIEPHFCTAISNSVS